MDEVIAKFKKDLIKGRNLEAIDLDARLTHIGIQKNIKEIKKIYNGIKRDIRY